MAGRAALVFAEVSQAVRGRYLLHTSGVFWRVVDVADGWGRLRVFASSATRLPLKTNIDERYSRCVRQFRHLAYSSPLLRTLGTIVRH